MQLTSTAAIVTGGASGLGAATASVLAAQGARVYALDLKQSIDGADRIAGGSPGAGLGLSIVQAVVKAHGGEVDAEPREGGGLVVTVTLPAAPSVE